MSNKKISELTTATTPDGSELVEIVQGGVNKKTTTQEIADLGGGGGHVIEEEGTPLTQRTKLNFVGAGVTVTDDSGDDATVVTISSGGGSGTVESVTGDGVDNTDVNNPVLTFPVSGEVVFTPAGGLAATEVQAALEELDSEKVAKETFTTLTFASPTNWDTSNKQEPLAKVTATGDFTINMTNVKSGSHGRLLIISSTASAFVLTFDSDFTNKSIVTGTTLTTWTFPALTGAEYTCEYYVDGTVIRWTIGDFSSPEVTNPFAKVRRAATQSFGNGDVATPITFDTEDIDNASIYSAGSPTLLAVPGSGDKIATVYLYVEWATNVTGIRRAWVYVNGASLGGNLLQKEAASSAVATVISGTLQFPVTAGDTIEIRPYQNSGGSLNVTAVVSVKFESR